MEHKRNMAKQKVLKKNAQKKASGFGIGLGKIVDLSMDKRSIKPPPQKYNDPATRKGSHLVTPDVSSILKEGTESFLNDDLDELYDHPLHSTALDPEEDHLEKGASPQLEKSTSLQKVSRPKKRLEKRKNLQNVKKIKKSEKVDVKKDTLRKTPTKTTNVTATAFASIFKPVTKTPKSTELQNADPSSQDEVEEHTSGLGCVSLGFTSPNSKKSLQTPTNTTNVAASAFASIFKPVTKTPKSIEVPSADPSSQDEVEEHVSGPGRLPLDLKAIACLSSKKSLQAQAELTISDESRVLQSSKSSSSVGTALPQAEETMTPTNTTNVAASAFASIFKPVTKTPKSIEMPSADPSSQDEVEEHVSGPGRVPLDLKAIAFLSSKKSLQAQAELTISDESRVLQSSKSSSSVGTALPQAEETTDTHEQSEELPKGKKRKTFHKNKDMILSDPDTVQSNIISVKIWCPDGMQRSSKDITELDIVLAEFTNIITNYKKKVESVACTKAIDCFFSSLKEHLTGTIEDVQKLKSLQKQKAKVNTDIVKKRKRLFDFNNEHIVKGPEVKQLRKEFAQLRVKKSSLKTATHFLTDLKELQKDIMKHGINHSKEKYGFSSLPALLLESRSILSAEKHLQNINSKLQHVHDLESSVTETL